jgi:shikimate dehydrogenase
MINARTETIAIFGSPIEHSLSPLIQNAWLVAAKLNAAYLAFNVKPENLKNAVLGAKSLGFKGINITVPHKVNILKYVDAACSGVKKIGSANTITIKNGRLTAHNTDYLGFIADLKANKITIKNKNVFVYGAGGAAKAVIHALNFLGAKKVFISNRTYKNALNLARQFKVNAVKNNENDILAQCEVFINTSSCGLNSKDKIHFEAVIPNINVIYDLIYAKETPFKKLARKYKIKYVSGEGLLVRQAAEGFKLWTGIYPSVAKGLTLLKHFTR